MSFQLGRKVILINDPAQAQLLFFSKTAAGLRRLVETDDDYQTATAFDQLATLPDTGPDAEGAGFLPAQVLTDETIAQADMLRILGFGDFEGAQIAEALGSKGITGVRQVSTLTLSALTATAGTEYILDIKFTSSDLRSEFASHQSDYNKLRTINLPIIAADTVTTLASRIVAQLNSIADAGFSYFFSQTSSAGVVTFTGADPGVSFTFTVRGTAIVTTVVAVTTAAYEGRNTYTQLKDERLETVLIPYAETFKTAQVPIKGAKYSCYIIRKNVSRPDLRGFSGSINSVSSGTFDFVIYINEASAANYILEITKWLNANVAVRTMFTATTPAGAIAAEAPVPSSVVDSTEPFTTGLV